MNVSGISWRNFGEGFKQLKGRVSLIQERWKNSIRKEEKNKREQEEQNIYYKTIIQVDPYYYHM